MNRSTLRARRIAGFGLTTPDAARLADFYTQAFGFRRLRSERLEGPVFEELMRVSGGAQRELLRVGEDVVELLQFDHRGLPYPVNAPYHRAFQHFALVVGDMTRAMLRLERVANWTPISESGPQRLPPSSGGVTAFKFRDPDGHPLEFLEFASTDAPARWKAGTGAQHLQGDHHDRSVDEDILGIDHSALSVADMSLSQAFYRNLGFAASGHSCNRGPEQAALDGVSQPIVEVASMTTSCPTPHVELLCYRSGSPRGSGAAAANDVAATRIAIEVEDAPVPFAGRSVSQWLIRDPDGHRLQLVADDWPSM